MTFKAEKETFHHLIYVNAFLLPSFLPNSEETGEVRYFAKEKNHDSSFAFHSLVTKTTIFSPPHPTWFRKAIFNCCFCHQKNIAVEAREKVIRVSRSRSDSRTPISPQGGKILLILNTIFGFPQDGEGGGKLKQLENVVGG